MALTVQGCPSTALCVNKCRCLTVIATGKGNDMFTRQTITKRALDLAQALILAVHMYYDPPPPEQNIAFSVRGVGDITFKIQRRR